MDHYTIDNPSPDATYLLDADGEIIAKELSEANAKRIALALNMHTDLVEALRHLLNPTASLLERGYLITPAEIGQLLQRAEQ